MANYTLTYSNTVQGWPSFYSFFPEKMIGMNQYLYSFSGGDLYRHNTNETRNNFYGVQYTSRVSSVFNDQPLENKLFKTISLEADSAWETVMNTDIQDNGFISAFTVAKGTTTGTTANKLIDSTQSFISTVTIGDTVRNLTDDTFTTVTAIDSDTQLSLTDDIMTSGEGYLIRGAGGENWFQKKEGAWFAYIRNNGPERGSTNETQWELRSLNGIGRSASVTGTASAPEINFSTAVSIGSKIGTGDAVYFSQPPYTTPEYAGIVDTVTVNKRTGVNKITLDSTVPGVVTPIPIQDAYYLFIQNQIAESNGILGHYLEFELENQDTIATEIIAVKSEVMKSYP